MLLGNIYDKTSAPAQTAFIEWNETINYFQEHCNAKGTHLIIHYPRNVDIMLIKMKGESHFHFLLRFIGLWKSSWSAGWDRWWGTCPQEPKSVIQTRTWCLKVKRQNLQNGEKLPGPPSLNDLYPWMPVLLSLEIIFLSCGHCQLLVLVNPQLKSQYTVSLDASAGSKEGG